MFAIETCPTVQAQDLGIKAHPSVSSIRFTFAQSTSLEHVALYRAWINGLDLSEMGQRYIGVSDPRHVRSVLEGLRLRFIQAAKRANMARYARLLSAASLAKRLGSKAKDAKAGKDDLPSLDDFAAEVDPDGCFGERELLEMYRERFDTKETRAGGAVAAQMRRERWIASQNDALFWIEQMLVSPPETSDALEAWLEGSAVKHLQGCNVITLGDLKQMLEARGPRWHDSVPGIGDAVADRITDWLMANSQTLGTLAPSAFATRLDTARSGMEATAKSMLESAIGRMRLDPVRADPYPESHSENLRSSLMVLEPGQTGLYASEQGSAAPAMRPLHQPGRDECLLSAWDDHGAMLEWIKARAGSAHTARVYRREAERFLLFLAQEKGIGLREMRSNDASDYRMFLTVLGRFKDDDERWPFRCKPGSYMAPRFTPRNDPRWRPFEGPLSARSAQHALIVVKSFARFLVQTRYLGANPLESISFKIDPQLDPSEKTTAMMASTPSMVRGLSKAQLDLVRQALDEQEQNTQTARLRFLLEFAYCTALRISEIGAANTAHLELLAREHEVGSHLMLHVTGKGGKHRVVYLDDAVCRAWTQYARHTGAVERLQDVAAQKQAFPFLVAHSATKMESAKPLGTARIYDLIKQIFSLGAEKARSCELHEDARHIGSLSPHDLRHTRGRILGQSKLPLPILQRLLGHASLATTGIYTTNSSLEMAEALAQIER